jgi:hypothetical protein
MIRFFLRSILLAALLIAVSPNARAGADVTHAALSWLALIDAGNYDDSWSRASALLQQRQMPDRWQARLKRLRDALGSVSMRSEAGISFSKSLPGFPDGSYATVRFQSSFLKQRDAAETVSLRLEDGRWRPVSYSLR